ncbi:MAG: hypothetical protein IKV52_02885, partial [Oscillospiraceae bacterium]|nr:hypothetical protein [Oscillospiraceae bacterium]
MQKLNNGILSTWYDNISGIKALPPKTDVKSIVGKSKMMNCEMTATITEYVSYDDISVQFEDGTI